MTAVGHVLMMTGEHGKTVSTLVVMCLLKEASGALSLLPLTSLPVEAVVNLPA